MDFENNEEKKWGLIKSNERMDQINDKIDRECQQVSDMYTTLRMLLS